jgi:hypothetical protein
VVDDEGQLFREQSNVEGMEYGAHARNGNVCLHVSLVVPHERGHAISVRDAQTLERRRQLLGAGGDLGEGRFFDS